MPTSIFGSGSAVNVNVNGTLVPEAFTATAGQTLFSLTGWTYTPGTNSLLVFINGQRQVVTRDFIETSSGSFTLLEGCIAGDFVDVIGFPEINLTAVNSGAVSLGGTYSLANYLSDNVINVKAFPYLAKGDGVTDDTASIRLAFDAMAVNGGQVYFPEGTYYCPSTVFIPISSKKQRISGEGAVLVGFSAGIGTIFETARGASSTGGVSNFGTNELYLHYNTVIEGLQFKNCEYGLKLNNFLQGCVVQNCSTPEGVKTLIYGRRCFYLSVLNNAVLTSYDSAVTADTEACFRFEDNNNGMVVQGNSALRSSITKGCGFYFSAGSSAVTFSGNTAERCAKGGVIRGAVYGMEVKSNYFEGNGIDLDIQDANYKRGLDIDANWFYSAIAIQAVAWYSGSLGKNNHYNGASAVTINSSLGADGALNSLHVWLPRQVTDETSARTTVIVPANWLLNGSIVVHRQSSSYLSATGPAAPRALLSEVSLGPTMLAQHNFVGDPGLKRFYATDGGLPYCTVVNNTNPGPGTIVISTQIAWDTYATGARFDLVVLDSISTFRMCGWVSGTTVFRDDALAQTCVASIVGGKLVLTLGNFTLGDVAGGIRII